MKLIFRIALFVSAGVFSLFIVSTTHGEKLISSFVVPTPTPEHRPFPLFTIRPLPTPTVVHLSSPLVGFCIQAPVIMYHHIENMDQATREGHASLTVDSTYFDQHIKYIVEHGYHPISAETLVNALISKQQLPQKSIVITLDDGYDDVYENAYPIAKKYGAIINLMIPTGLMENAGYLRWTQLQEMESSGLVKIYNHTWSHASLSSYQRDKIITEVTTAQQQLKDHALSSPKILFYPYGAYNTEVINILREFQFTGAFSTEGGATQCDSFLFSLHRIHAGNADLSHYSL